MQEACNALCSGFCDDGGQRSVIDVLDAMEDHTKPGKDAVVFAEVRGEFPVETIEAHEVEVLFLKLLADLQGAVSRRRYGRRELISSGLPLAQETKTLA